MKNFSFKNKIMTLILTIIVIFALVVIIAITNSFNSILQGIIFENERNKTAQKSELTANWFEEKKADLEIYANTQIIQSDSWDKKLTYLQSELNKRENNYFFFFIADQKGNYSTTIEKKAGNISDRRYFQKVLKGKTVVSDPLISKSTGEPIIVLAAPINNQDRLSLLGATIKIKDLSNYINRYTNTKEGLYSFIINAEGNIVAHPEQEKIKNQYFYNYSSFFAYDYSFIADIIGQKKGDLHFEENGEEKHAFYQTIPGTDNWKLVSILPHSYLNQSIEKVNNIIIIITVLTIIIAVVLSIYLAENIAKPIIQLKNTFKKGASGNLNVRSDIKSNDEIGEAAQSFNKMMAVIKDLSFNDALTGLPNINFFKKKLNQYIKEHQNEKIYVCAVGIDDFKTINDSFGHNVGNEILKKMAERLSVQLKEKEVISRVGDEFYFHLSHNSDKENIKKKLANILENINSDYFIEDHIIYISSSLGVTVYPDDSQNPERMIKNASLAMHYVKRNSSNKMAFYSINIDNNISEKKRLENQLQNALAENQFTLYYQSFIDSRKEKIVGFEALIRWQHPEKGLIPPGVFIPLAEENGLIKEIGDWVLEESCREIKKLNNRFNRNYFISVNVSPEQFISQDFIKKVKSTLQKTGLKAENLELEITERTTVENIDYTVKALNQLQELGVKTSIDDFGTGYSSLNYIKEFAINTLKIDKSFIDEFITDNNNRAIVNTIITLAHSLNLEVVAEGVETINQAEKLKAVDCDLLQGYYYSHPEPIKNIITELEKLNQQ
ncbi:EAL domain-containing protein [Halanaerobium kushneri]|jgi:diguanylate cyclase (GGDEF)-like protein|uniref:Diguanylate cyclase (GGDEF) domain-containing protein n=1 Tax=Halanaerobium kushneri TaxID=56779 RepID=A0A1N6RKK9_9FIRM|nr:EAL domain-containing protein [Halanaerobium kushneri]SIQ29408.1 diguanylate cyclase (GGDEF) domain-containing protein [Halanaerobium kushneri]